jgi:hypothetical protein
MYLKGVGGATQNVSPAAMMKPLIYFEFSHIGEEIADNTTCWCLFCTEPQHVFVFAENTIFCCNHLHKTHNPSLAALITN